MAGNIPISQVPNLKQAEYQREMPVNLMASEGAAMQGLGNAMSRTAGVLDQWHDKRQAHDTAAATAKAQLAMAEAETKLQSFQEANPDSPAKWEEERSRLMGAARTSVDASLENEGGFFSNISGDGVQQITRLFDMGEEKSRIKLGAQVEKRGIEMKNSDMLQYGKNLLANGDRDGALKVWGGMTMPNEQKIKLIEHSMQAGRYEEVLGQIQTAPTLEDAEGIYERLTAKKDGEYTDFNEDIGAMPYERRVKLQNIARNAVKVRKIKAAKSVQSAVDSILKGEDWELGDDVSEEQRVAVEQYAASTVDGFTEDSDEYVELEKEIIGYRQRFTGDRDADWFATQWEKINGGSYNSDGDWIEKGTQFNRAARMSLIADMAEAEAESISDNEEDVEGEFWDRNISPNEKLVRTSLKNRVDVALSAMAKKGYAGSVAPEDYGRAYQNVIKQIRIDADAGMMEGEKGKAYLDTELPRLMNEHVKPLDTARVRDVLRGAKGLAAEEIPDVLTQADFDALEKGARFNFNGEILIKK